MEYTLQETLKPLVISMKLTGLYHNINDDTNSIGSSPAVGAQKSRYWRKLLNSSTYSLIVIFLLWFNFIRYCIGLMPRDTGFSGRVVSLGWYGQCAINATVMYFACHRITNLPAFVKHWNTLFDDLLTTEGKCEGQCSMRYVKFATATGWVLFLLNVIGVLYLQDGNLEEAYKFRLNAIRPFPDSTAVLVVCSILHVIDCAAWVFPVVFVVALSYTVKLNFDCFSKAFAKHINESENSIPEHLESFRIRHLNMCKAVAILDRVFMYLMSVSFGSNIILCCFVLYGLINTAMEPLYLTMNVFWLCSCGGSMVITALSSALVNDAAHSPLDHIFCIKSRRATADDLSQLQMFIAKLSGTNVGFTVLNMIVITKETMLTISGVFVTYFFLLLQFKIN